MNFTRTPNMLTHPPGVALRIDHPIAYPTFTFSEVLRGGILINNFKQMNTPIGNILFASFTLGASPTFTKAFNTQFIAGTQDSCKHHCHSYRAQFQTHFHFPLPPSLWPLPTRFMWHPLSLHPLSVISFNDPPLSLFLPSPPLYTNLTSSEFSVLPQTSTQQHQCRSIWSPQTFLSIPHLCQDKFPLKNTSVSA